MPAACVGDEESEHGDGQAQHAGDLGTPVLQSEKQCRANENAEQGHREPPGRKLLRRSRHAHYSTVCLSSDPPLTKQRYVLPQELLA
ncbi:hypothetical protein GCM10027563_03710 [Parasphingorhabdus pacifica]